MSDPSPESQIAGFLAKYTPEMSAQAQEARARVRALLPGAVELVYDNYNALVFGFGATDRASEAVVSLAIMPRWVSLCFLQDAATLPDPEKRLLGQGKVARHLVLKDPSTLDEPAVRDLLAHAIGRSAQPISDSPPGRVIVKSISAKQRPRRP